MTVRLSTSGVTVQSVTYPAMQEGVRFDALN